MSTLVGHFSTSAGHFYFYIGLLFSMKTLKLFHAVISKASKKKAFVSEEGFIIEPGALWAKKAILKFYREEKLSGNDLNQTFHKSWAVIQNSSRSQLLIEQIKHYLSTYGSQFQAQVYIPDEILDLPDIRLYYQVIKAYTPEEMTQKCLELLQSGVALKEETIDDLLSVLVVELGYTFTGDEDIQNKEAIVKIANLYGILPKDTMSFFRYIILQTTGESLLIKSKETMEAIRASSYNPAIQFKKFGLKKLAAIFNRFKPLFLCFKSKCPKTINKISKLSKKHHKPLAPNPLNQATTRKLSKQDLPWLDRATPFALLKALSACYTRAQGQTSFLYRIRNGKSWARDKSATPIKSLLSLNSHNYQFLLSYLQQKYDLSGRTFYLPEDVVFALPTSEKMFVGNIPTGTRFYAEQMAVGIYWTNEWGARDIDLSGLNIMGKIGWNSSYNQSGHLLYSGDITNAPDGAVEYLYAQEGLDAPTLVMTNVFEGSPTCAYKIIIGKGDEIDHDYMMNPNNLFVEVMCNSVQKGMVLGLMLPQESGQCFTLLNFGAGNARVSSNSKVSDIATRALSEQWTEPLSFNELLRELGAVLVDDPKDADHNFELHQLERDSFFAIFSSQTQTGRSRGKQNKKGSTSHPLAEHKLPAIGPVRNQRLLDAGYTTLEDLVKAGPRKLSLIPTLSEKIATKAVEAAEKIIEG